MKILDVGSGINGRVFDFYDPEAEVIHIDKIFGFDIEKERLPKDDWDVIFCNHIIEHVADVDVFLNKCTSVMGPDTVLEIATPNLCAWFNRLVFLFGYLPHSVELSSQWNVGKIKQWKDEELGGHIRVFNLKGLIELLYYHNLEVIEVRGERSTYPCNKFIKFIDWLFRGPNTASAIRVKCKLRS